MQSNDKYPRSSFRRLRYWLSVVTSTGLLIFLPATVARIGIPVTSQKAAAASDPVIAAAGDIACDPADPNFHGGSGTSVGCREKYTSDLLINSGLSAIFDLGDNQYFCGGYQAYLNSYNQSWGRVKSITHPAVGNHEYLTYGGTGCSTSNEGAAGYFQYFGSAAGSPGQGYYSFDVGTWHIIALNSSCGNAGGCASGSPQYQWLQSDLAAHKNLCTLAYWHVPLFSSGGRASSVTQPLWLLLYNNNADVVLNGHDHIYERFAPQNGAGQLDRANGIREFVVGAGGANHTQIEEIAANSQLINTSTFGVLKLTLHQGGYDWQFVHETVGTFSDAGSDLCHGPDTVPPSAPGKLMATSVSSSQVALAWTASSDNVGVVGYQVFRNGTRIASVNGLSYTDLSVQPQTSYDYYVVAYDAAQLSSSASNTVNVSTPAVPSPIPELLFRDAFEDGDVSKWNHAQGLIVQSQIVASGSYAARGTSVAAGPAYARKRLLTAQNDLYFRIRFDLLSRGANNLNLMQFLTSGGQPILTVRINALGNLGYRNNLNGIIADSPQQVGVGAWQRLKVHVHVAGTSSRVDTWYNGTLVSALSRTEAFGSTPVDVLQFGDQRTGITYDIAYDEVRILRGSTADIPGVASAAHVIPVDAAEPSALLLDMDVPAATTAKTPTSPPWIRPRV